MSDQSDNLAELAADQRSPDEDSEASRRPLLPESVSIPLPESDRRDLQNEPIISEQADAGPSQPTRIELDSHVLKLKG